jgi:hypothetical protein
VPKKPNRAIRIIPTIEIILNANESKINPPRITLDNPKIYDVLEEILFPFTLSFAID